MITVGIEIAVWVGSVECGAGVRVTESRREEGGLSIVR